MSNIKVLLTAVCDYTAINQPNLPFCKNDLVLIQRTINNDFEIDSDDIISLGWTETTYRVPFRKYFRRTIVL